MLKSALIWTTSKGRELLRLVDQLTLPRLPGDDGPFHGSTNTPVNVLR
jgi:hypothetical protein